MTPLKSTLLGAALFLASLTAFAAITEGRTANDRAYMSGGIGLEESERLKQMADKFSLQVGHFVALRCLPGGHACHDYR